METRTEGKSCRFVNCESRLVSEFMGDEPGKEKFLPYELVRSGEVVYVGMTPLPYDVQRALHVEEGMEFALFWPIAGWIPEEDAKYKVFRALRRYDLLGKPRPQYNRVPQTVDS